LDRRCRGIGADRLPDYCRLEQQWHHREQRRFPIGHSNRARTPREPAEHHGLRLVIDAAAHAGTFAGTVTVSVEVTSLTKYRSRRRTAPG